MKQFFVLLMVTGSLIAQRDMNLSWIIVDDLGQAVQFYSEVVGLKPVEVYSEMGWAEMEGTDGQRLGLAQACQEMQAGNNAVVTITVEDIVVVSDQMEKKGAVRCGDVCEVPGHCKLQLFADRDGNQFQLHQPLG